MGSADTVALIVGAGRGERAGSELPKQFAPVAGRPMIAHSHAALSLHPRIDRVVTVIGTGQEALLRGAVGDVQHVVGGATRRESVRGGLEAIGSAAQVLIHDAARPFVPATVVDRLIDALGSAAGAVPTLPIPDTIGRDDGSQVSREGLHRIQTPQAFAFDAILAAHRDWPTGEEATDDAQMLRRAGGKVVFVAGDNLLDKVTYPADFAEAERRAANRTISRSATGFDVHRLETGEELWLGGIPIPHDKGLSGHSDADVALHALTDALLGTIGAGDIGTHFPPSDPQWRGASSDRFLVHAADLIAARGGRIDFVDLTLICEAPKIGPHRAAITERIAMLLRLPAGRVSVKATTTERLGFAGRGEGIAAQAIATVRVPEDD